MGFSDPLFMAVAALLFGAVLLGIIAWGVRWLAPRGVRAQVAPPVSLPVDHDSIEAGVLLVQTGGRVVFVNERAREFFGLNGQAPNLERMTQKVKPADAFQTLLVAEGQASLSIGERQVEATSLRVPSPKPGLQQFVVVLRETDRLPDLAAADGHTLQVARLLADVNRDISSSLALNDVFDAVLRNVGRALPYNLAEITLFDEATQQLRSARRAGDQEYVPPEASTHRPGEGLSGWITTHRQPLFVSDPSGDDRFASLPPRPQAATDDFPFQSYLGVPLLVGQRFLGTLEVASYKAEVYKQSDLFVLNLIAEQAASAIYNAQQFEEQARRVAELTGLAEITRAIESTSEPRELYERLTADIARFMGVQMVGFLFYSAEENALVGQPPFYGVPDIVANFYHIPLGKGSVAESIWREHEHWLSNNVMSDPAVEALGLRQLAETAGVKSTLMAPISLGGRRLGVVQISNKVSGAPFTDLDVRLLLIFAGQAAAILDNARLVRESQERAEQAEGLRRIAATAASGTGLDEILRATMRAAADLIRFEFGVIALLDEARGELAPHPASVYGGPPEEAEAARLRTDDPMYAFSVTRTRRPLFSARVARDRRIRGAYRSMVEHYGINSVMNVPLVVSDRSIGEMIAASRREQAFTRADLQLLSTIASQLASAIERARLYAATDQDLQRRVDQLTALTRVGRELNQTLQLERILGLVHTEALNATQAQSGTIVLLDLNASPPGVALRIGEEQLGMQLTALEAEVAGAGPNVKQVTGLAPDSPYAVQPEVRAALVVPILTQGVVGGLIHLHSHDPAGFDGLALETASALASQTAVAVVNAQRYEEQLRRSELLRRRADQLAQLFEISRSVRSDRSLVSNLETIAFGLQEAVGFNVAVLSVLDPQTRRLRRTAAAGMPLNAFEHARQVELPWDNVARVLLEEYRISQSYFLPYEKAGDLGAGLETISRPKTMPLVDSPNPNAWHPKDLLLVPLRSPKGDTDPIGVLSLDNPRNGQRPDRGTLEVVEIFANQAALAIENTRLYQAAERRASRLLALHRVVERASREPERGQVWQTVAEALWAEMGRDVCLIALVDRGRLSLHGQAGRLRTEIDFGPILASEIPTPLSHVMEARAPLLVPSARESAWAANALVIATEVTSFVSVPILRNGEPAGAIFVGSHRTPTPFVPEDQDMFLILANQLGALLESAQLEADIHERAGQLAALAVATRNITAGLRTEDVIQAVLAPEGLRSVIPFDSFSFWVREGGRLRIVAAQGFENDAERIGLTVEIADSALFAEMAATRNAILVPDVQADDRFPASAYQPTRAWLGAPLVTKDRIIGALALDKREAGFYSGQAVQVLMAFANQTAVAFDNARLFEESRLRAVEVDKRSQRLALLNRFSGQLSGTLKLDRIFEITLTEVMDALNVELGAMVAFNDQGEPSVAKQILTVPSTFDPHNPVLMRVRESLAPVAIEDVEQDAALEQARSAFLSRNVKSLLVVPLAVAGLPIAAIQLEEVVATRRFSPDEIELAQTLANQAAVAVQNARLYDETQTRLAELATLDQISRSISSTIDIQLVYRTVGDQVSAVMGVDNIYLALFDQPTGQLTFPLFLEHGQPVPVEARELSSLAAHIIHSRRPLLLRGNELQVQEQLQALGVEPGRGAPARSYLGVPLIIGERLVGLLAVQDLDRYDTFDYSHERILTTIAAQVVVAIENARLYAEVQTRADELSVRTERLAALNRLSTTLSASLDLDTTLQHAAEQVTRLFGVDHSGVVLFDTEGMYGTVHAEYPDRGAVGAQLPLLGDQVEEDLITRRLAVAIDDVASDPRLGPAVRQNLMGLGIQSILIVPFISQGETIGSFSLDAVSAPRQFTPDEVELGQIIAAQIAVAVENARFTQELESRVALRTRDVDRERERVETVLQIATELASNLDLDRVLSRALQLVTEAVNAPRGSVFILDLTSDQLIYRAALGRPKPLPPGGEPSPVKRNEGLVGWVMKNRQGVVIGDLDNDPRWKHLPERESDEYCSALAVPLMANEDALGAMILLSRDYDAFDEEQLRLVAAAADRVGDAINNAELYRLIREQAERLGGLLREQQVDATKNRAILEGIADGVLVADAAGEVIILNAACERLLGLQRDEVVGRPINEFVGIYGAAGKAWLDTVEGWSADPYNYRPGEFFAERIETDDNRVLSVHLSPVIDADEYLGSVSLIRDITREVEVDRLKSEFVTNVSHELRTPMTSIKGYADLLLMGAGGPLNDDQARFLDVIKNNADRLSMLVNDLLDISRIESGRVQLVMRPIQLGELLTETVDNLRGRIDEENKPMHLVTEYPADLPPVQGDRERLIQIIMNLADNAFNYSHAGGTITFQARLNPELNEVVVRVTDSGIGIAPEDQPRLFDRFYRGEDALVLATAGTGLGLPIARQLAEMHGGRLLLERSEPGRGSTFALSLPLAPAESMVEGRRVMGEG